MKEMRPRRGGWSGGPVPEPDNKLVWWYVAIGLTAVAVAIYVAVKS